MAAATMSDGDDTPGLEDRFRAAFQRLAATVALVSYYSPDGQPVGMTATSVCSLSLMPPSLVACINRETTTHEQIAAQGRFAVNILSAEQQEVAEHCSRPGRYKQLSDDWLARDADIATPALANAVAHLECEVAAIYPQGTHSIFVGHVVSVLLGPNRDPLLYCNRNYRSLGAETQADALSALWDRFAFGALS